MAKNIMDNLLEKDKAIIRSVKTFLATAWDLGHQRVETNWNDHEYRTIGMECRYCKAAVFFKIDPLGGLEVVSNKVNLLTIPCLLLAYIDE